MVWRFCGVACAQRQAARTADPRIPPARGLLGANFEPRMGFWGTTGGRSNPRVLYPALTPPVFPVLAIFPTAGALTASRMATSPFATNTSNSLPPPKYNTGSACCNFCNFCNSFVTVL